MANNAYTFLQGTSLPITLTFRDRSTGVVVPIPEDIESIVAGIGETSGEDPADDMLVDVDLTDRATGICRLTITPEVSAAMLVGTAYMLDAIANYSTGERRPVYRRGFYVTRCYAPIDIV